jgi:sortase A
VETATATATTTDTPTPTHTPTRVIPTEPPPELTASHAVTATATAAATATATPTAVAPPPTPSTFEQPHTGGETPDVAENPERTGPSRIVIGAIGLDSKIVPVGWHIEYYNGVEVGVWDVADYVVGWHVNSAVPGEQGNIVLSGHHNIRGEVFRYVVNLEPGNDVTVYMGDTPHYYRVQEKFILRDKGLSEEEREANAHWIGSFPDERVTLVTCWPYTNNTHRVIVIAKPVAEPPQ